MFVRYPDYFRFLVASRRGAIPLAEPLKRGGLYVERARVVFGFWLGTSCRCPSCDIR